MAGYIGKNGLQITEQSANVVPAFSVSTFTATATVGESFTHTPTVTDPDKIAHSFYLTASPPAEYDINSSTGVVTANPVQQAGTISFELNVTDGPNVTTQNVSITVSNIPVSYSGISGTKVLGVAETFTPTITNPNNVTLTFALSGMPGFTIDSSTGVITGTYTATGTITPTVTVTDQYNNTLTLNFSFTTYHISIVYSGGNEPSGALYNNQVYTYTPTITNPSNVPLTFVIASQSSGGLSINSSTGVITGTPTTVGSNTLSVTSTDQYSNVQTFNFSFSVGIGPLSTVPSGATSIINSGYGVLYANGGTHTFTVPNGISYVRAVAVGGGGTGNYTYSGSATGGSGGGLGYKDNISVSAGNTVSVTVGGTSGTSSFASHCSGSGGSSSGSSRTGGSYSGDGGGQGGNTTDPGGYNQSGGGGSGGYSGQGGSGTQSAGTDGSGGAGGGGGGGHWARGGGGGGTGVSFDLTAGTNGSGGLYGGTHSTLNNDSGGGYGTSTIGASDGSHSSAGAHGGSGGGGGAGGQTNYGFSSGTGGSGYVAVWWQENGAQW
jgi:hypothetical protein